MDTYGWVSDQVNAGTLAKENFLCPSNPMLVNEKLLDAYGLPTNDNLNAPTGGQRARLTAGICGDCDWQGMLGTGDASEGFASTDPLTTERAALLSRYFIEQGYNTNYVTSWFLTYTAPRIRYQASDQSLRTNGQAAQQGLRGKRETLGPLTRAYLGRSDVPSSHIALLGDGAPGDWDEAITPVDFAYQADDPFSAGDQTSRTFVTAGSILSESSSEGPVYYHRSQRKIKRIGSYNSRLEEQWRCDRNRNCPPPTGGSGNRTYMQSTVGWMATHGGAGGYRVNFLFADGSVRSFMDRNGDGFLNPGFPVPNNLTEAQYDRIGFRDDSVELHPSQFFSGVFIAPKTIQGIKRVE